MKNLRNEMFVRAYVRLHLEGIPAGHIMKAYKEAYPHAERIESIYAASSRLFNKPHIQKRIQEVNKRMITRADITEDRLLGKYEETYDLAKEQGKTADMVSATTAQAKLVGLLRDRLEAGAPGDFDNMENVSDVLAAVEKQAGPKAALALANALGVKEEEAVPEPDTAELEQLESPSGSVN